MTFSSTTQKEIDRLYKNRHHVELSIGVLREGETAVRDYRKFLSAGCSVPPIEALKLAGIDMSRPEPLRQAMKVFRDTVERMKEVMK